MLAVAGLRVEFRGRTETVSALNGVDLQVERGEIVGLVGETGSGKTVTSLSILGLVRPPGIVTAGEIRLDDLDLRTLEPRELRALRSQRIAYIPQDPRSALNPLVRIGKQMSNVIRSHTSWSKKEADARSRDVIEAVGIPDPDRIFRAHAHELSGGMAQRAVIAIALLLQPELVIADEPTTGLDVTVQAQILDLFRRAVTDDGAGALLVTHDLGVVANYCSRVCVMYGGRVVETGTVSEVFAHPRHPLYGGAAAIGSGHRPTAAQPARAGAEPPLASQRLRIPRPLCVRARRVPGRRAALARAARHS